MRNLAEQVAAWENETSVQALTPDERESESVPLYQSHLPKLDEEGVVEYEQARGLVEKTPVASQSERYLVVGRNPGIEPNDEGRGGTYLLGVSFLTSLFFVGTAFQLPFSTFSSPFSSSPPSRSPHSGRFDRPKHFLRFPPPVPTSPRLISCFVQAVLADIDVRLEIRSLLF